MADLTHRADCHANGVGSQYAAVVKDDLEPVFLCYHHLHAHSPELTRQGWQIVRLVENDDCDTEVVKA